MAWRGEPLVRLADGTVKQINPFTGTQVWTVPGRANRPLAASTRQGEPVDASEEGRFCAFCEGRYLETPPEKVRMVRDEAALPSGWRTLRNLPAYEINDTVAEFRLIPNLFEILPLSYWVTNHDFHIPSHLRDRADAYVATEAGRKHVFGVVRAKLLASGMSEEQWEQLPENQRLAHASAFFMSSHDVIVARRHLVDGAATMDQLASSGTLTPEEHHRYTAFTADAVHAMYELNPHAEFVAAFQNWLAPAGASFDHLHKQVAAVDEFGRHLRQELETLSHYPDMYNEFGVQYAARHGLVVAQNEHAVAFAGFGHRYPSLEIYSRSEATRPWEHGADEMRGMSDLLHACHAATGSHIPCNEEWHYQPPSARDRMPWRVVLKWRISTLAGFEGSTKININTVDPWTQHNRVVDHLRQLRVDGRIAPMAIGEECEVTPDCLQYSR